MLALIYGSLVVASLSGATPAYPAPSGETWVTTNNPAVSPGWTTPDGGVTFVPPAPPPPPSPAQQCATLLGTGLSIVSTGSPALTAVYPVDALAQSKAMALQTRLSAGLGFPGGATTLPWKDAAGAWHALTPAQFTAISDAISVFVARCDLVMDGMPGATVPAATATIP